MIIPLDDQMVVAHRVIEAFGRGADEVTVYPDGVLFILMPLTIEGFGKQIFDIEVENDSFN